MNKALNPSSAQEFLTKLAEVWPEYRALGCAIAQRSSRDAEYERGLLIDSQMAPGELLRNFTGVREIQNVLENEVEFTDLSGQRFFAVFDFSGSLFKLISMKIECPACFGEPQEEACTICDGAGKI